MISVCYVALRRVLQLVVLLFRFGQSSVLREHQLGPAGTRGGPSWREFRAQAHSMCSKRKGSESFARQSRYRRPDSRE